MATSRQQTIQTMSVSEARKNFSDVVTRPLRGEGRVIVEKSGTPVGAIVSIDDLRRLEESDRERSEIESVLDRRNRVLERLRQVDEESRSLTPEERKRAGQEGEEILSRTAAGFRGIPEDEIQREIEKAIAEVKAEYDAERRSS